MTRPAGTDTRLFINDQLAVKVERLTDGFPMIEEASIRERGTTRNWNGYRVRVPLTRQAVTVGWWNWSNPLALWSRRYRAWSMQRKRRAFTEGLAQGFRFDVPRDLGSDWQGPTPGREAAHRDAVARLSEHDDITKWLATLEAVDLTDGEFALLLDVVTYIVPGARAGEARAFIRSRHRAH